MPLQLSRCFFSRNGDGANFSKIQWQYCLLISPPPKCPSSSYTTLFKNDTKKIKIIDQIPLRAATLKLNIVFTIGRSAKNLIWSSLLTWGPYWPKTNMSEQHFARHSTWPYLARLNTWPNMPNMAKYAKYAYLGAYMGAPNMVKWGVPEKILQMQFSIRRAGLRSIGPSSQKLGRIKSRLPGRTLPA